MALMSNNAERRMLPKPKRNIVARVRELEQSLGVAQPRGDKSLEVVGVLLSGRRSRSQKEGR